MMRKTSRITKPLLILLILLSVNSFSQKNDTVYMLNGDRITGELKKFESGILFLSTDGMSTLNIEYDKIGTVYSGKFYEIVTSRGFSYYGSVVKSKEKGSIGIGVINDTIDEPINEIVEIIPIRKKFLHRFSGAFDLGLSYYKSTNIFQYYINGDLDYRSKKSLLSLTLSTLFSDEKNSESDAVSRKNDADLSFIHFFQGNLLGGLGVQAQQNTELDLKYRFQIWGGLGYDFVHTNPVRLYSMAGVLVNREQSYDTTGFTSNFEGLVSLRFKWLQYRHPKINISSNIDFYPSFSVKKRYRVESDLSVRYEIFNDFYFNLTFYDNYDNKSSSGTALNDYGVVLSISYTFD